MGDPKFKKTNKCPSNKGGCLHASWVGDGRCDDANNNCACNWDKGDCCGTVGDKRCDDENNNCGCNWDGGDCCGVSGDTRQFSYCKACKCLDPAKANAKKKKCGGTCKSAA